MARPLALTLGEPAGIGLDITLAAWRRRDELKLTPFYFLADPAFVERRAKRMAPDLTIAVVEPAAAWTAFKTALPVVDIGVRVSAEPGHPDQSSAPAALAAIRRAVADVCAGAAAAIVTNPVAKNVLYRSGFAEPGHTEFLARLAAWYRLLIFPHQGFPFLHFDVASIHCSLSLKTELIVRLHYHK